MITISNCQSVLLTYPTIEFSGSTSDITDSISCIHKKFYPYTLFDQTTLNSTTLVISTSAVFNTITSIKNWLDFLIQHDISLQVHVKILHTNILPLSTLITNVFILQHVINLVLANINTESITHLLGNIASCLKPTAHNYNNYNLALNRLYLIKMEKIRAHEIYP